MTERKSEAHHTLITIVDEKLASMLGGENLTNMSDAERLEALKDTSFSKSGPVEVKHSEVRMEFDCPRCGCNQNVWPDDPYDDEVQCENCELWIKVANPIPRGGK